MSRPWNRYNIAEVATLFNVSRKGVERWIELKLLRGTKNEIGRLCFSHAQLFCFAKEMRLGMPREIAVCDPGPDWPDIFLDFFLETMGEKDGAYNEPETEAAKKAEAALIKLKVLEVE